MSDYDVVVVGAGPTGENVADRVVRAGRSAAIVESELVGGECSYWACMPSKALLRPAAALADARAVAGSREAISGSLDAQAVLSRRDEFTSHWKDDGQVSWLDGAGITLVRGHGRLAGPKKVQVGDQVLTARQAVVLATGSDAAVPDIEGIEGIGVWTSREATSAKAVPARLAVIGGGVVACEMAAAWAALGSRVTMLVRSGLLGGLEPFAGEAVATGLHEAGVDVRVGVNATKVQRDGAIAVTLDNGETLECDELLAAAGRRPKSTDLGLETVGLTPGSWLDVDDNCRVGGFDWLYAAGDLNHRALLTHMGKYQARACAAAIVAGDKATPAAYAKWSATADRTAVPQIVFTHPEVAAVGLTERQAREKGLDVRAVEYEIGHVAGASLYADGYRGTAKMVVDEQRKVVVGVTMTGPNVGELIHAGTVAVVGEVPLDRLWHAVPSYPAVSEIWLRLLEAYGL